MRVRGAAGEDLGEDRRREDAEPLGFLVLALGRGGTHGRAGELGLEPLVGGELHGYVGEAKEGGGEARVEGEDALGRVHLARGVEGGSVVPRGAEGRAGGGGGAVLGVVGELVAVVVGGLRHQPRLDDPYWIGGDGAASAGDDGRPEVDGKGIFCVKLVVCCPSSWEKPYRGFVPTIFCSCCRL